MTSSRSPKMMVETLNRAQSRISTSAYDQEQAQDDIARLQYLIDVIKVLITDDIATVRYLADALKLVEPGDSERAAVTELQEWRRGYEPYQAEFVYGLRERIIDVELALEGNRLRRPKRGQPDLEDRLQAVEARLRELENFQRRVEDDQAHERERS